MVERKMLPEEERDSTGAWKFTLSYHSNQEGTISSDGKTLRFDKDEFSSPSLLVNTKMKSGQGRSAGSKFSGYSHIKVAGKTLEEWRQKYQSQSMNTEHSDTEESENLQEKTSQIQDESKKKKSNKRARSTSGSEVSRSKKRHKKTDVIDVDSPHTQ